MLEVGCGNGWMCRALADIPMSEVKGADINGTELSQAKRVFSHIQNLEFIPGSINAPGIKGEKFDCIVFASSIQYFASIPEIINLSLQKLKPGGELHILDSPFYQPGEVSAARKRTADYFTKIGSSEMTAFYFHHDLEELHEYQYKILYKPTIYNRYFLNNKNPFPWICIFKS